MEVGKEMKYLKKVKFVAVTISMIVCMQFSLRASTVKDISNDTFTFTKQQISEINSVIKSCGPGVSVFYKDLNSGYTYTYNSEQKYFIASLIKAPYCMYIYDLASQGKCDLNKRYTYAGRHKAGGTGKIQYMSIGTSFTLEELIGYAIKYSDNVAMNMLKENFPIEGYRAYAKSLGLKHPEDIKYGTNGNITATDAGIYIESINNFINNNTYGSKLRTLMLSTSNPMITSSYPVVRKYGWATASFHDMAIVEAPYPYLLSICTNHDGDYSTFKKISQIIEKYSQVKRIPNVNYEAVKTNILLDGSSIQLSGYNINNSNYYKLRDIAYLLNGSEKQFDMIYDIEKKAIIMQLGESYLGGESNNEASLLGHINIEEKEMPLYIQDKQYQLLGYMINDNTYVKIRDVAALLEMEIGWSNETKELSIVTKSEVQEILDQGSSEVSNSEGAS